MAYRRKQPVKMDDNLSVTNDEIDDNNTDETTPNQNVKSINIDDNDNVMYIANNEDSIYNINDKLNTNEYYNENVLKNDDSNTKINMYEDDDDDDDEVKIIDDSADEDWGECQQSDETNSRNNDNNYQRSIDDNTQNHNTTQCNQIGINTQNITTSETKPNPYNNNNNNNNSNGNNSNNNNNNKQEKSMTRLFLKPIPADTTAEDIREFFQKKGFAVVDSYVPLKKGKAKGYGFVGFSTVDDTKRALELNNSEFKGCRMSIAYATGKEFSRSDDETSNVLFLRNLPKDCSVDMLKENFPNQKEIRLMTSDSGGCRGIAFIEFSSIKDAIDAKSTINDLYIEGRKIGIEYAQPKNEKRTSTQRRLPPSSSSRNNYRNDRYYNEYSNYRHSYDNPPLPSSSRYSHNYDNNYYDRNVRRHRVDDGYRDYYAGPPPPPPPPPPSTHQSTYYYNYSPESYRYPNMSRGHTNPGYYRNSNVYSRYTQYDREPDYRRYTRK